MKTRKRKRAPGAGRKPAGEAGEKSSRYPMVRIAPDALEGLKAIAAARAVPLWQVMSEAARLLVNTSSVNTPRKKQPARP